MSLKGQYPNDATVIGVLQAILDSKGWRVTEKTPAGMTSRIETREGQQYRFYSFESTDAKEKPKG